MPLRAAVGVALRTHLIVRRALCTSVVVGSILNVINQIDGMVSGKVTLWKMALTYAVPFCVVIYSAACVIRDASRI